MLEAKQLEKALEYAVEVAKEYGRGGYDKAGPDIIIERAYRQIIKILEEIHQPQK